MVRLNRPAYSLDGPGPKAGLWFMGQFSLDSSDIISGFDGILKKHSLGFFFSTILIRRQISRVEEYRIALNIFKKQSCMPLQKLRLKHEISLVDYL